MMKVARILRPHREFLLNCFRAPKAIFSGVMEGLNNKLKLTTRKSYGFRTFRATEVMLYLRLEIYLNRLIPTDFAEDAKIECAYPTNLYPPP
jgi:hypothetical protein